MKKILISIMALAMAANAAAQGTGGAREQRGRGGFEASLDLPEVYRDDNVVFRKIDDHTWIGSGHVMASESLYLLEGSERAVLIDAGTEIPDLDKIVAKLTDKPVTLLLTHVHPDHVGGAKYFSELWVNPSDIPSMKGMMPDYTGKVNKLKDGQRFELGGRTLETFFTPGHTWGSTTFLEVGTDRGFSGDSFGNGNLLLTTDFSTLINTCKKSYEYFSKNGYVKFYNGHFFGDNFETLKRISDLEKIGEEVLAGALKGEERSGMPGLNKVVRRDGVNVNYGDAQMK